MKSSVYFECNKIAGQFQIVECPMRCCDDFELLKSHLHLEPSLLTGALKEYFDIAADLKKSEC